MEISHVKIFFVDLASDIRNVAQTKVVGDRSIWMIRSVALRALGTLCAFFAFRQFCKGFLSFGVFSMTFGIGLGCVAHDLIKTGLNIRGKTEKAFAFSLRALWSYVRSHQRDSIFGGTIFFKHIIT